MVEEVSSSSIESEEVRVLNDTQDEESKGKSFDSNSSFDFNSILIDKVIVVLVAYESTHCLDTPGCYWSLWFKKKINKGH